MKKKTNNKSILIIVWGALLTTLSIMTAVCQILDIERLLNDDRIFEDKTNQIEERLDNVSNYSFIQKTGVITSKYYYVDDNINHYMFIVRFDKDQKETIEVGYTVYMSYEKNDYFTYCVQGALL